MDALPPVVVHRDRADVVPFAGSVAVQCSMCAHPCWLLPSSPRDGIRLCVQCSVAQLVASMRWP